MNGKKLTAAVLLAIALSACGGGESKVSETAAAETTDETVLSEEVTTEETTAETTETTAEGTTAAESVSETAAVPVSDGHFALYEPEVKDGVPEVCDLDTIKAMRRADMAEKYTSWREDYDMGWRELGKYSDAADFAENYFGYSFDSSDPVTSYVEDDFDLDGKTEYYICMAEYVMAQLEPVSSQLADADADLYYYDISVVASVYYADDDGTPKNVFSRLVGVNTPETPCGYTAEDALANCFVFSQRENNLKFQFQRGYFDFLAPLVIDNGDSKHLLWKNGDDYPADAGAYIFWLDRECRVEISSPSASLGGFYEWGGTADELFWKEREKFGDDFWATEINLATKLDLYTYPELNGKVNTSKWNGENYVYDIVEEDRSGQSLKSGAVEWN